MTVLIHERESDLYEAAERHRINENTRAMSRSGLLVAVILTLYALAFDRGNVAVPGLTAVGMAVGFFLVRGRHPRLGIVFTVAVIHTGVTLLAVRHGANAGAHFGFALIGLAVLAVFETWVQRVAAFTIAMATAAAAVTGRLDFLLDEPGVDTPYETAFFTLTVMVAAYWLSDDLLRINREFRVRSRAVVDEIGARSSQLAADMQRLGRQSEDLRLANAALSEELTRGEHVQRQLRVSREQLEQFVYAASHDLKEPLRSISGFVQLIRRKLTGLADADLDAYAEIVLSSSAGMTRLLDGLLAYSRADADGAGAEDVDLARVAALVRHDLQAYATERGGSVEIAAGLGRARCAKRALRVVLTQVVHNALKFSAEGEAPRVAIGPCPKAGATCLVVRDYGIGIEPSFRERVFHLFQRLNHVDAYEGAGIGLALAYKLARANGISLSIVTPPEGPGTVFLISCPEATQASQT